MKKRSTEIRTEIRELKREMKARGTRVFSCFNGGHTPESMRCNERLYALKLALESALAMELQQS